MTSYDNWRTRCVEHEWDDMENRVSKVYAGYRTEIDDVIASLSDLSDVCEEADIHDPFGVALSLIKDWVRGVVPNYK